MTATTSFTNISSDESLNNKPALSSAKSSDSSGNMTTTSTTTSDSVSGDQYMSAKSNPTNNNNPMMINQPRQTNLRLFPSPSALPPPPPPPQEAFYGTLETTTNVNNIPSTIQHQAHHNNITNFNRQQSNDSGLSQFSGNGQQQDGMSMIYGQTTYRQPQNFMPTSEASDKQQPLQILQTPSDQISAPANINPPNSSPLSYKSYRQQHSNNNNIFNNNNNNNNNTANHSPNNNQRSSTSSLDSSSSSAPLMPINVKGMLLHGLPGEEVLRNWLVSIKCEDYIKNFADHGYDINLVTRMTPQDLAAIGCKAPALRKKLILEIKKLNIEDQIPDYKPSSLDKWLESLKLGQYYSRLISEGFDSVEKVCKITWEDLEEIGITKLGHQKKFLLAIEKVQKLTKLEEDRQNDNAIYDVHPNHRVSLNGLGSENRMTTLSRVRSGFFQTRSGANLDHRGLPVAKVMPALKHVNSTMANQDPATITNNHHPHQQHINIQHDTNSSIKSSDVNGFGNNRLSMNDRSAQPLYESYKLSGQTSDNNNHVMGGEETFKMSDLATTLKRNPPPLPPVRTNSLKFPQATHDQRENNFDMQQPIYDNNNGISAAPGSQQHYNANRNPQMMTTNSTSFLRTPKLGTLTATTNKMLTVGGLIQTISGQQTGGTANLRPIAPIREAPLPPNQHHHHQQQQRPPATIHENAEEETTTTSTNQQQYQLAGSQSNNNYSQPSNNDNNTNRRSDGATTNTNNNSSHQALMGSSSLIGHQLASADEFPPPPPCQ